MYSFLNLEPVCFPYPVLTVLSWPAYIFLKRQVRWSGIPISFRIFLSLLWYTQSDFGILNKAEVDVFPEFSCFLYDPTYVGNLISVSSVFSKSSLNIWKFTVHILLAPGLNNFEHYFASMWDELPDLLNAFKSWLHVDIDSLKGKQGNLLERKWK